MIRKNNMNKIRKYIFIVTLGIFMISSVLLTIESVATGAEMANLKVKEQALALQNRQLDESFVKSISVSELQTQSDSLGFVNANNLIYVGEGEKVASKN